MSLKQPSLEHTKGEDVFITRIPTSFTDIPFKFKRLQFPVRPVLAMSIDKVQGHFRKVTGINLKTPCFSADQLYVGCSRVETGKSYHHVFVPAEKTGNIVYQCT